MSTTTVKIRKDDKERLDRIKARLTLKGKKLNQEELLGKIIAIAESHPLLLEEDEYRLSEKMKTRFMEASKPMGKSSEEEIDQALYRDQQ